MLGDFVPPLISIHLKGQSLFRSTVEHGCESHSASHPVLVKAKAVLDVPRLVESRDQDLALESVDKTRVLAGVGDGHVLHRFLFDPSIDEMATCDRIRGDWRCCARWWW